MVNDRLASLILVASLSLSGSTVASAEEVELSALSWLTGCWAAERGDAGSGEHWLPPAGGTMLGVARTVKNGETIDHEFLQIRRNPEGRIVYIALPSGQAETSFLLTRVAKSSVTFENPEHDFPQRIVYRLLSADRLHVRIEGERGGALDGVDFQMRLVPCEALSGG